MVDTAGFHVRDFICHLAGTAADAFAVNPGTLPDAPVMLHVSAASLGSVPLKEAILATVRRVLEAVFALDQIEAQVDPSTRAGVKTIIDRRMSENDEYWSDFYNGTDAEAALLRTYSYSDRIRYYWSDPEVSAALDQLITNLKAAQVSETVVSQFFSGFEFGEIPTGPEALIARHVQRCVHRYYEAAGYAGEADGSGSA